MPTFKKPSFQKNRISTLLAYTALACAINLVVFLVINQLSFVFFQMNDDFTIQNLLNGSMGEHYIYFPHMNVVLSAALSGLYTLTAAVNWYGIYLFLALLLSSGAIGAILMDKFEFKVGLALYLLTLPLLFGLILTQFTYTLVCYAMLACAVSCLIYGFYMQTRKTRRFLYVVSVLMLVSSILLRREVAASALVYCVALAVLMLLRYRKRALTFCAVILVGFAVVGAFTLGNNLYAKGDPEVLSFQEFHEARINLVDREALNYARDQQVYDGIGWTETDVSLYRDYYTYPDDAKFSTENMEYIYDCMQPTHYMTDANAIASNLASTFAGNNLLGNGTYVLLCLFVIWMIAFLSQKKILFRIFTIFLAALPFLFQILFNMMYRTAERAVYPHYMLSIIALLFLIDGNALAAQFSCSREGKKKAAFAVFLCVIAATGVGLGNLLLLRHWDGISKAQDPLVSQRRDAFETMYLNPDSAYLYPISSPLLAANESYSIFHAFQNDYFKNNRLLGGWDTRSPAYNDFKERYGLASLPLDLVDNQQKVYLVIPNADPLTSYYYNDHQIPVTYEVVTQLTPDMQAVRVVTGTTETLGTVVQPEAGF